jgi:mannose-6-phosphate isomerase-like protein (cupin superfamily)
MGKYVIHSYELSAYTPPAHSQTANRRLLGPGTLGSKRVEVILGEIGYGGQADLHSHRGVEQAFFVIQGKAVVQIEGESEVVGPDDFIYLPPGTAHRVTPLQGPPLKILILYAPPLSLEKDPGGNPQKG